MPVNEYGQMIGEPVDDTPGVLPSLVRIEGQYTIVEALSVEKHAEDLLYSIVFKKQPSPLSADSGP